VGIEERPDTAVAFFSGLQQGIPDFALSFGRNRYLGVVSGQTKHAIVSGTIEIGDWVVLSGFGADRSPGDRFHGENNTKKQLFSGLIRHFC
jgi:hypothetical protein